VSNSGSDNGLTEEYSAEVEQAWVLKGRCRLW
jgi:hypothetical protein